MGNGARIVLVESASRFARDHVVQAMGFELLKKQGVSLIPCRCSYALHRGQPDGDNAAHHHLSGQPV